jgi:hypothetical protein
MRLAAILLAVLLSGCAATKAQVTSALGDKYSGKSVDALVLEFGPPKSSFQMASGETAYQWELTNRTNIDTNQYGGQRGPSTVEYARSSDTIVSFAASRLRMQRTSSVRACAPRSWGSCAMLERPRGAALLLFGACVAGVGRVSRRLVAGWDPFWRSLGPCNLPPVPATKASTPRLGDSTPWPTPPG